jgi:exopolysaccharide biosynthesis protein
MPRTSRRAFPAIVLAAVAIGCAGAALGGQRLELGTARDIAPGITLFHSTDVSVLQTPGLLSMWLLRLEPGRVDLRAALANDEVVGLETVADTAARAGAIAAINAGFFLKNGDPAGLYKIDGRLISDTARSRGAVGIVRDNGGVRLIFDRLTANATLVVPRPRNRTARIPIAGIDTTRLLGRLMLFTPAYHAHTDTAAGGTEWVADGDPARIAGQPRRDGKTPIPRSGFVLSYGGPRPPPALRALKPGTRVQVDAHYLPAETPPSDWAAASDIIGGAGLLARDGRYVDEWAIEKFGAGFAESRHPRTMIGTTSDGIIWLVVVDGRQPQLSSGMTLKELQRVAQRLALASALNLDGGGSTTMWVRGQIVNSPSDAAGPRKVSDSLLVFQR